MKIINNKEEFIKFVGWSEKYTPQNFPEKYPCIAKKELEEFGIMGDANVTYVCYFPEKGRKKDFFLSGLEAKWNYMCA